MTYSEYFINNFFLNFSISLIFIIYLFIKSSLVNSLIKRNKLIFFDEFSNIIIFFLILSFYTAIFNLLIIIKYIYLIKYLLIISFLSTLCLIYYNLKKKLFKKIIFGSNYLKKENLIFILLIVCFFLISILPLSDADSIAYHLNFPFRILSEGYMINDIQKNLMFSVFANNEIILTLSVLLKSDNFGSILNYIILIFFIFSQTKSKYFKMILLSCPLLIFLISTQKLQLAFAILFLILFINIHERKLKSDQEIFILCILLVFYASIKTSYILISIPLFIYLIINYSSKIIKILLYCSLGVLIFFAPLFLIKHNIYYNIFAPFFDNFLGNNNQIFKALEHSLKNTEGWIGNIYDYKIYFKIFIPTNLSELSATYGLLFLILFFNYELLKKLNFFPIFIVLAILISGQILPRYYLEAFLILAYYLPNMNVFTKMITYSQLYIMLFFSTIFLFHSYDGFVKKNFKHKYQERFAFSFYNAEQLKNINFNKKNTLTFADGRQSIFYGTNFYSSRYISVMKSYNDDSESLLNKFVKKNNINYIIHENLGNNLCFNYNIIDSVNQKIAVRNFLIPNKDKKYYIYQIINTENCEN